MIKCTSTRLLSLLICSIQLFEFASAEPPEIVYGLSKKTIPLDGRSTMMCTVRADWLHWYVNGVFYRSSTDIMLRRKGFSFTESTCDDGTNCKVGTVTVDGYITNNNTVLQCSAASPNEYSVISMATILIADTPLPPNPVFLGLRSSSSVVEWEVPFTWEDFPILNYTVEVVNQTSSMVLARSVLPQDVLSYNFTHFESSVCTNISFSVTASSSIGTSSPGVTYGALPASPGIFDEYPSYKITMSQGIPYLEVNFTVPFLCPYNNATYVLVIGDSQGRYIHRDGPHHMPWSMSGTKVTVEIRNGELRPNMNYTINITVSTTVGQSNTWLPFTTGTTFTSSVSNGSSTEDLEPAVNRILLRAGSGIAAVVGFSIFAAVFFLIGFLLWKKENRKTLETNTTAMMTNPIYGDGVIYEEIANHCVHFKALPKHVQEGGECSANKDSCSDPPQRNATYNPYHNDVGEENYIAMNAADKRSGAP